MNISVKDTEHNLEPNERLKALRQTSGLTRQEFSDQTGIGYNQLEAMERGIQRITMEAYNKIGEHYPREMAWLIFESYDVNLTPDEQASLDKLIGQLLVPHHGTHDKKDNSTS